MLTRPSECRLCDLDPISQGFMRPEGLGTLSVMGIAEALGEHECADGLPLRPHAPAGSIWHRTLKCCGIDPQQMVVTNLVHCRPPRNLLENQSYEVGAVNHCRVHLDREIQQFQPKVILAMGGLPLRYLTGYAGKKRTITNVRGFILDGTRYQGIPVIPTYHPSYIQRDKPNLLGVYRLDLLRAVELARRGGMGGFTRPTKRYTIFPPIDVAQRFLAYCRANPDLPICYDIETEESITGTDESELKGLPGGGVQITRVREEYHDSPEHLLPEDEAEYKSDEVHSHTRITQIQFSLRPQEAIVIPFTGDYIGIALAILSLPNTKWGWNIWQFDNPLLEQAGARIEGRSDDMMWGWHHLQPDLPRGLQYACSFFIPEAEPWKHRSTESPGEYGGDDVGYLRKFGETILTELDSRGIRQGYERHIVRLNPIMVSGSKRGVPVDNDRRMKLGEDVDLARAGVDGKLQEKVPLGIRNIEPKQGYANPKIAEKRKAQVGMGLEPGQQWGEREFVDSKTGEKVVRACRVLPFLPNSGPQILTYIRHRRGLEIEAKVSGYLENSRYRNLSQEELRAMAERNAVWKVPREFKTDKETTAKKELERLGAVTGDEFFKWVVEHREYGKLRSTYVDGWTPNGDGCVHTTFTYAPATGQLSSRRPNVQNAPKRGRLADSFRKMIRAKPGHRLIEVDKTAFHALTLGFEARCPEYMRLARLDIHSFVAANMIWLHRKRRFDELRLPHNPERWFELPDEELKRVLGIVKTNEKAMRDGKAKPSILGIGFGLGYRKLFDMNRESFENLGEARQIQGIVKGLFPRVFKFQDAVRRFAHSGQRTEDLPGLAGGRGVLISRHQYLRWFFDIYHWDAKSAGLKPGKDSEAAIAFLPANDAFGMIKEEMITLDDIGAMGAMEEFGFINQIHDSLMFHCWDEKVEEALHTVVGVMTSPSRVLVDEKVAPEGLRCGVEVMVSPVEGDWTQMEKVEVA